MPIPDLLQPQIIDAIERLGFPTVLILILIWMINYMIKKNEQRQILSDQRYQKLVEDFVTKIQDISNKHQLSIEKITKEFSLATKEFKSVTTKLDSRMQICMAEKEHHTKEIIDKLEDVEKLLKNNDTNDRNENNRNN